jgi:antitoxin component of RelBE/YafQ-DinJ toxin-antitoxin module
MAKANRQPQTESRKLLFNVRIDAAERAHLKKVAADRSLTVSDVIREALRRDGVLPTR